MWPLNVLPLLWSLFQHKMTMIEVIEQSSKDGGISNGGSICGETDKVIIILQKWRT
uniref:Uncharacterized protein n=1 Tax=Tetranychus urticae TaxID=32264 RepID=T1L2E3_TETUR